MTDRVQIREAVEGDGDAIGEAHAAAWLAAYTQIFESDSLDAAAESRRSEWPSAIRDLLAPPNILLVGAVNGRVVAFAHAAPVTAPDTAEITGFYCHPDAWGTGISAALMTQTKVALADCVRGVFLWTLRDAARARRFYAKVGFRLIGSTRAETLTNWTTGAAAARPAVEFATRLADERRRARRLSA
jgi:N-acetylglutamate synthase-like GNAT family acetyltransferase